MYFKLKFNKTSFAYIFIQEVAISIFITSMAIKLQRPMCYQIFNN